MSLKKSFLKHFLVLGFAVLIAISSLQVVFAETALPPHTGDINGDGVQTDADSLCYIDAVLANLTKGADPSCQVISDEGADLLCDGDLNVVDTQRSILIYRYLYNKNTLGLDDSANKYAGLLKKFDQDMDMIHDDCDEDDVTPWDKPVIVEPNPVENNPPVTDTDAIWPTFGNNIHHSGKSANSGPSKAPTLKWSFHTEGIMSAAPIIDKDGTIYVGSHDANFYALNPDGSSKWKLFLGAEISAAGALANDGTIYLNVKSPGNYLENGVWKTDPQSLWAIDSETGVVNWKTPINEDPQTLVYQAYSSPTIGPDGIVYAGSLDGHLYAVDSHGVVKWKFKTGDFINSSAAIGVDSQKGAAYFVYFASSDGNVYALDNEGNLEWSYKTNAPIVASVAVGHSGAVYVNSTDGNLYALDPTTGKKIWSIYLAVGSPAGNWSSPAIDEAKGMVYVGGGAGLMSAVDFGGAVKWQFLSGLGKGVASPVIGDDENIYFSGFDKQMYCLDSSGQLIWKYDLGTIAYTSPAIGAEKDVYVSTNLGLTVLEE